jgi:hypothetical protein
MRLRMLDRMRGRPGAVQKDEMIRVRPDMFTT